MTRKPSALFWRVYGWPLGLAVLSMVGLLSALLGDGAWDAFSWIALGIPLAVILWREFQARRRQP
jgi:hypothetical protein